MALLVLAGIAQWMSLNIVFFINLFGHTSAVYGFSYKNVVMYFSVHIYMKPGTSVWELLPGTLMLTVGFWFYLCIYYYLQDIGIYFGTSDKCEY
jgi:hypothetical protein